MFKRRKPEDDAPPPAAGPPGGATRPAPAPDTVRRPDTGIGVPPFRPAAPPVPQPAAPQAAKELPAMGRSPLPPTPSAPPAPGMNPGMSPGMAPGLGSLPTSRPGPAPGRAPAERRTLVVGRGISVQGTVTDAERLVVEGTVEATMIHATELVIAQGGIFKGEVEVEDTEIAGVIDGTLTARGNLVVRATGKVLGTARCRRLQVEDGGQITGRIEMITGEPAPKATPATTEPPPAA